MSEVKLPSVLYAGDKLEFTESDSTYKASAGWTMKYDIIHPTATKITLVSVADGDNHKFTITSVASAAYTIGEYRFLRYAAKDSTYEHLDRGPVEVKADIRTLANYDFRTHAQKVLDAIEANIEGVASKAQRSIQIAVRGSSRALEYWPLADLYVLRNTYKQEVENERRQDLIAQGKPTGNKNLTTFKETT